MTQPEAHQALFYRDSDEYVGGILDFIGPGLERDEPVAIAVPAPHLKLLRAELEDRAEAIELLDMCELGRNPGRIIPAVLETLERHGGKPLRYVGEPIWPGRSAEGIREATRHEALINLAWPDADISVLCPYDAARLDDQVLLDAEHTHPGVVRDGRLGGSAAYGHGAMPDACEQPLSAPPPGALERAFEANDLGELRTWVGGLATGSGLGGDRASELVIAINELTTNTVKHADTHGLLRFWPVPGELIFQIEDAGHIVDPLAGRRHQITGTGGLGLWMVNQLCDLVEVRTSVAGTTIRVHSNCGDEAGRIGVAA
ncbi:MAG: anti-sigma factor RsbA family regulatory protein [Solirubrobacteraceae bacterium]